MIKILLTILSSVALLACLETNLEEHATKESICDCKELQHDPAYNVLHLGDRLKPFTGKCYDYYRSGKLKKDYTLKEGKYEGTLKYYFENGQLQSEAEYKTGLLFGSKKVYNQAGVLLFHGIYKRSRLVETIYLINSAENSTDLTL